MRDKFGKKLLFFDDLNGGREGLKWLSKGKIYKYQGKRARNRGIKKKKEKDD